MTFRELRHTTHMSQERAAEAIGVDPMTLRRWETGASVPRKDHLDSMARVYKQTIETLLEIVSERSNAQ